MSVTCQSLLNKSPLKASQEAYDSQQKGWEDKIISDHNPMIVGDVLSWNILNQCFPMNNAFRMAENPAQYYQRLARVAAIIAEIIKNNPKIKVLCLQEAPNNDVAQKYFLSELAKHLPNFVPATAFDQTGTNNSARITLCDSTHYVATQELTTDKTRRYAQISRLITTDGKQRDIANIHIPFDNNNDYAGPQQIIEDLVGQGCSVFGDTNITGGLAYKVNANQNIQNNLLQKAVVPLNNNLAHNGPNPGYSPHTVDIALINKKDQVAKAAFQSQGPTKTQNDLNDLNVKFSADKSKNDKESIEELTEYDLGTDEKKAHLILQDMVSLGICDPFGKPFPCFKGGKNGGYFVLLAADEIKIYEASLSGNKADQDKNAKWLEDFYLDPKELEAQKKTLEQGRKQQFANKQSADKGSSASKAAAAAASGDGPAIVDIKDKFDHLTKQVTLKVLHFKTEKEANDVRFKMKNLKPSMGGAPSLSNPQGLRNLSAGSKTSFGVKPNEYQILVKAGIIMTEMDFVQQQKAFAAAEKAKADQQKKDYKAHMDASAKKSSAASGKGNQDFADFYQKLAASQVPVSVRDVSKTQPYKYQVFMKNKKEAETVVVRMRDEYGYYGDGPSNTRKIYTYTQGSSSLEYIQLQENEYKSLINGLVIVSGAKVVNEKEMNDIKAPETSFQKFPMLLVRMPASHTSYRYKVLFRSGEEAQAASGFLAENLGIYGKNPAGGGKQVLRDADPSVANITIGGIKVNGEPAFFGLNEHEYTFIKNTGIFPMEFQGDLKAEEDNIHQRALDQKRKADILKQMQDTMTQKKQKDAADALKAQQAAAAALKTQQDAQKKAKDAADALKAQQDAAAALKAQQDAADALLKAQQAAQKQAKDQADALKAQQDAAAFLKAQLKAQQDADNVLRMQQELQKKLLDAEKAYKAQQAAAEVLKAQQAAQQKQKTAASDPKAQQDAPKKQQDAPKKQELPQKHATPPTAPHKQPTPPAPAPTPQPQQPAPQQPVKPVPTPTEPPKSKRSRY